METHPLIEKLIAQIIQEQAGEDAVEQLVAIGPSVVEPILVIWANRKAADLDSPDLFINGAFFELTPAGFYLDQVLRQLGSVTIEPLIELLGHKDRVVRQEAAFRLIDCGDARAVEPLIQGLEDDNETVVKWAISALGKIADARAVEPLLRLLSKPNGTMKAIAAIAAGQIGDKRATMPLLLLLQSEDTATISWAVRSLGQIGDPRAVEPLIAILNSGSRGHCLRESTAEALGKLGDPLAIIALRAALNDPSSRVVEAVELALQQIQTAQTKNDSL